MRSVSMVSPVRDKASISVGGVTADISGFGSEDIQLAADTLKVRGGGVIKLNEGVYKIKAPIRLYDDTTLTGVGDKTVLRKIDGLKTGFVVDADYGELFVKVENTTGFCPGMGIQIFDSTSDGWDVSTVVITGVEGNTVYFDNHLCKDYQSDLSGTVSNACSIIEAVGVKRVEISNLAIDGNKRSNEPINGCRGGGIYIHKSAACLLENLKVYDFSGDGISWQITEDVTVRNCEVFSCSNFGLHPGTGSVRTAVTGCSVHDNASDGIFVCWRVQNGRFIGNSFSFNGFNGINIGHKDTDNLFESNKISGNAACGVYLRPEKPGNGAHRNVYRGNTIEDNGGGGNGCGVFIESYAEDNVFEGNTIRDNGKGLQKYGIFVSAPTKNLKIEDNVMSGHVSDMKSAT